MTGKDFKEHLKIDNDISSDNALATLEAIAALPDLMRGARLVDSSARIKR